MIVRSAVLVITAKRLRQHVASKHIADTEQLERVRCINLKIGQRDLAYLVPFEFVDECVVDQLIDARVRLVSLHEVVGQLRRPWRVRLDFVHGWQISIGAISYQLKHPTAYTF